MSEQPPVVEEDSSSESDIILPEDPIIVVEDVETSTLEHRVPKYSEPTIDFGGTTFAEHSLLISRFRRQQAKQNNELTFLNRVRKSDEQVRFLINLFDATGGRVPKEIRQRAERETGLQWIQIYKWIFDRKQRRMQHDVFRLLEYPVPIFRVTNKYGKDITTHRPIFKIERVKMASKRASGKSSAY